MLNYVFKKTKHIPSKIKREALRIPVVQSLSKRNYQTAVNQYASRLPLISSTDSVLVNSIREEGVFVTSLEDLAINSTPLMIDNAKKLLPELKAIPINGKNSISLLMSKELIQDREMFLWGLEERLLDIIENYLSLPAKYVGMHLRRQVADGITRGIRQWHIDVEDYRRIKIIIYLNDVDEEGGPFEYLSKELTTIASNKLKYKNGFIADRIMERVIPKSDWKYCPGKAGTVIFADTCNIFHRAQTPVRSDRFSLTFGYTSRLPISLFYPLKLSQVQWEAIADRLSERQRECLLEKQSFF